MIKFLVSCEHGGNQIPLRFQKDFNNYQEILQSHRGWDTGSLGCAFYISKQLDYPIFYSQISRLLIENNRTLSHPDLFSTISKHYSKELKETIINEYYLPYRNKLEAFIKKHIELGHQVIHLSIHSFTPILNGVIRKAEVGILFDPKKELEKAYASKWQKHIQSKNDNLRVKFNYPYLGIDDGLTTYFRTVFPENYAGLELEINQKLFDCYPLEEISNMLLPDFKFDGILN